MANEHAADYLLLATGTPPPTPSAGQVAFYRHTDGKIYIKKSDGSSYEYQESAGAHPDLAAHLVLGLSALSSLTTHEAATDPHTGYVKESDANWLDLTDSGETALHTHAGGGGAPTTADYLVGTAQAGLSAEIVVGTAPGGELGGTWAAPSVDVVHAGTTHATQRLMMHCPLLSASPWTNMPAALSFWLGTATAAKHIQKVNLTNYTQVRLLVFKSSTAGPAGSKLILRYRTTFSQTATDYSDIGTSEVSVAINVQNSFLDTGYINLAAGAKAEVFVALLGSGGDGVLDPAFGIVEAEFK